ncbi:MAG: flagellar biosynthetic protein FliR [Candidatus Pelagisphaera sp.]|jgi:flagellar biosynthetic protein FliR
MLPTADVFVFMLILTRMVGLFLYVPFFAHNAIPLIAKAGFSVAFALIIFPLIDVTVAMPSSFWILAIWMAKELAVGLAMGFAVRMLFWVLDFAAYILTVEIGLSPGAEFDPSSARGAGPLSSLMYFLGMMVLLLTGGEYDIFRAFISSYEVSPIGYMEENGYALEFIVLQTAGVFRVGILMAAPVIAVNFLVNLVFAVLGKVVPKLNVFILSFSVRILAGTAIFSFSSLMIIGYILRYTEKLPEMMMRFIMFRPVF